jgi:hypothetical protein
MPLYQSLRRIKGKGFTYDFNLHEEDIVKIPTTNCAHLPLRRKFNPDDEA